MSRSAVAVFVFAVGIALVSAQEPAPSTRAQALRTTISAIVVDAVVRDARGRPVTDLRKEDFQILEDGVEQQIGDLTMVGAPVQGSPGHAGRASSGAAQGALADADPARSTVAGADFMAIVFDRLSPDARALAYQGALAAVDRLRDGDFVGVFLSNMTLETIQPYTNDRERIGKAIRDVASRATAVFDRTALREVERDERANILPGDAHPSVPDVAGADSEGRPVDGRSSLARLMGSLQLGTHMSWEALARDQQGHATTNALMAVTSALGMLPGRKTVVFFAEGLAIPDAVLPHFRNVVTTANRANVSVYTIDTAGLRVHSQDAAAAREITAMAAHGTSLAPDGSNLSSLAMLERNEDVLRKDPRTALTLLAEQTGGFLIENTNDLAGGFNRIDDDRRFHYLLTYTPRKTDPDGRWRTLTVRVPGRNVIVRARSGYLALGGASTLPVLAYEAPALAALDRSSAPAELPVRARAFVFPGASGARTVMLAATDGSALRFDTDSSGEQYRTDFSIVARIVDARGTTVRKSSQPYRLAGPVQQTEQAKRGQILFFRQPQLPPGAYTLEAAVHDALSGRTGVHRTEFVVPETPAKTLHVSSLVLVSRAERAKPEPAEKDNPLFVGDALIYPNLGEPVSLSREKALTFFVSIAGAHGAPPTASMQLLTGTRMLAEGPITMPAPGADGKIDHVLQIPIDALPPGRYMIRLSVSDGDRQQTREAGFELRE